MRLPFRRTALTSLAFALMASLTFVACGGSGDANAGETSKIADEATDAPRSEAKPVRIAQGQEIALTDHLVEGKITVFDFMSDFCPPCVQISPWLDRLHAERDDIDVVKIDVNRPGVRGIDWRSPVLRQYGISSIPHFKIYGADGELMAEGQPAYERLVGWLQELPQPSQTGR